MHDVTYDAREADTAISTEGATWCHVWCHTWCQEDWHCHNNWRRHLTPHMTSHVIPGRLTSTKQLKERHLTPPWRQMWWQEDWNRHGNWEGAIWSTHDVTCPSPLTPSSDRTVKCKTFIAPKLLGKKSWNFQWILVTCDGFCMSKLRS